MLPTPRTLFPNNIKNTEAAARLRGTVLDCSLVQCEGLNPSLRKPYLTCSEYMQFPQSSLYILTFYLNSGQPIPLIKKGESGGGISGVNGNRMARLRNVQIKDFCTLLKAVDISLKNSQPPSSPD